MYTGQEVKEFLKQQVKLTLDQYYIEDRFGDDGNILVNVSIKKPYGWTYIYLSKALKQKYHLLEYYKKILNQGLECFKKYNGLILTVESQIKVLQER